MPRRSFISHLARFTPYITASLFLLFSTAPVNAQALRLTTSPLPINLTAKPGQTVATDLRIRNSGNQPETLKVGLLKFTADDQTGIAKLQERQAGDDYFDWVTFSHDQFTLAPNQWQTVKMTIDLPNDAAFGYYYAVTFTRVADDATDQAQQAVVIGSTATLVLLEAENPNAHREVSLESFTTNRSWYEFLPVDFIVTLRNTGNIHSLVSGNIFITQGDEQVETLEVNQLKGNILPDSIRSFITIWSSGFPVWKTKTDANQQPVYNQQNQPVQRLDYDFSKANQLRFGKYTAHLVLAYDDGTRDVPLEAEIDFWVIPWRLIVTAIAIPVIPAVIVYLFMKWRFKKSAESL